MSPKDIKTPADVARWLKHHVEWSDESSRDMMLAAVDVLAPPMPKHEPNPGEWGVWCIPSHPQTSRWPEHWWGQFWSTKDKVPLGQAKGFDEAGARAEAAKQAKLDPERGYRYEARPLLSE